MKKINFLITTAALSVTYLTVFLPDLWLVYLSIALVVVMMLIRGWLAPTLEKEEAFGIKLYATFILSLMLLVILAVNALRIPFVTSIVNNWFMTISVALACIILTCVVPFFCGKKIALITKGK
jgi:hypothetical protein